MDQGNQSQKRNLAATEAFRRNYAALQDALAQPHVASELAIKLCNASIITSDISEAVQSTSGITSRPQAHLLLDAIEASITAGNTRLRKFSRLLRKVAVLEPIAKRLHRCYSKFMTIVCTHVLNCELVTSDFMIIFLC